MSPTLRNRVANPVRMPGKCDTCRMDSGDFALRFVQPVVAHIIGRAGALRVVAAHHLADHNRRLRMVRR